MDEYVDGFLLKVPVDRLEDYKTMSSAAGKIWKEHGALDYRECVGDDLDVQGMRSFKQTTAASENEAIVFAWITYPNRAARDRINADVMADPRLKGCCPEGIFDMQSMSWGGFKTLVHV